MNTFTLITGGIFGWIVGAVSIAAIVINSERQDRKRAARYERALERVRGIVKTNLGHQTEKLYDVVPLINDALADRESGL